MPLSKVLLLHFSCSMLRWADRSTTTPLPDDGSVDPESLRSLKSERAALNRFGGYYRGSTLNEIARYGGYASYDPPGNTDRFVAEAMKSYSRPMYESLRGFTRRGAGTPGLYSALHRFDGGRYGWSSMTPNQRTTMRKAISLARERFTLSHKEEPLDWHEVGQYLRKDTSAGVTWPGKKKGEVMEQIYPAARWLGHRMKQGGRRRDPTKIQFPPCIAAKRGSMSPLSDPKTRMVWVYPSEMLVVEGLWAPRMYERFLELPDSPLLTGKSPGRIASNFFSSHSGVFKKLGLDFSAFDSSVPAFLIKEAFDILHRNIDWEHWRGRKVPDSQRRKWRNVWDNMVWYFINTPVLMPDGRMFRKLRGVPSGTFFTSLIDSVVNYIVVQYLALEQGEQVQGLKVLGDDSAGHVRDFDLTRAVSVAWETLGMVVNAEKSELSEHTPTFKLLGQVYRQGRPHRETEEWFKLLLYPEDVVWDLDHSMSRFVGLWMAGAMYDLEFCKFWNFFQTGFPVPGFGRFTRNQRRMLSVLTGKDPGEWWQIGSRLFDYPHEVH